MTPQELGRSTLTRRTFMKNSALTVGAISILSRGTALAEVPSGKKEVTLKQTYTINTPEAIGYGFHSKPTTDTTTSHNTQYSLAIEDAIKNLKDEDHLTAGSTVKGLVPISAKLDHIKTSGGPNNGKPYTLLSHSDGSDEVPPDGAIDTCNVAIKILENSTEVIIEYIWE